MRGIWRLNKVLFWNNSTTFTKPLNQPGIVIRLNFQVNTAVSEGAYDISCKYGSFAKNSLDSIVGVSHAVFKNGLIMIGSYGLTSLQSGIRIEKLMPMEIYVQYGDINGDGNVDSIDFGILRRYILGMITWSYTIFADVDGLDSINSIDFALLRMYLLGMISVLRESQDYIVHQ